MTVTLAKKKYQQSELLHIKEKEKMTVIFITHNIQEAISLGNKIMVMSKNGTIKEKMDNPISKPVTPASEGYGELWEHLNNALTEENKEKWSESIWGESNNE